jgi:histidinol-phosphate aminotransferase
MPEWDVPSPWPVRGASLAYVANPNSPSGTTLNLATLERFAEEVGGPLVIDEAYVDFADTNALPLLKRHRNVIITRSLSKSYSLAGIRFGFAVADAAVVRELVKVKDSYNCDALSLAAATAALGDQAYLRKTVDHIRRERQVLSDALTGRRFAVTPSQANFVWCRRSDRPLRPVLEDLKRRHILVRYFAYEGYGDGLRITVGTDAEIDRLLEELQRI